jgi:hypothetical protein
MDLKKNNGVGLQIHKGNNNNEIIIISKCNN